MASVSSSSTTLRANVRAERQLSPVQPCLLSLPDSRARFHGPTSRTLVVQPRLPFPDKIREVVVAQHLQIIRSTGASLQKFPAAALREHRIQLRSAGAPQIE